jgi:hypothetical protein
VQAEGSRREGRHRVHLLQDALISPVLTAHPTEVQRKSILDAEHDIARLLAERDLPLTPKERAANLHLLRARIATLWQTRMLRYSKLTVADEIENALSYYRITFLRELPACTTTSSRTSPTTTARHPDQRRTCRWAAGSAATATATRTSTATPCARADAPGHHHPRLLPRRSAHAGRRAVDLDPDGRLPPELQALADQSPTPPTTAPTNPTAAP